MKSSALNYNDLDLANVQKDSDETTAVNSIAQFSLTGKQCIVVSPDEESSEEISPHPTYDHGKYLPIGHVRLCGHQYLILTLRISDESSKEETDIPDINILTKRELQIALQVANGKVNKQIAYQLHLSEWTVSTHLRRIYAKLNVKSRAEMVAIIMSKFL